MSVKRIAVRLCFGPVLAGDAVSLAMWDESAWDHVEEYFPALRELVLVIGGPKDFQLEDFEKVTLGITAYERTFIGWILHRLKRIRESSSRFKSLEVTFVRIAKGPFIRSGVATL